MAPENQKVMRHASVQTNRANKNIQTLCKHSPATVDSDRENVIVESLFYHVDDLSLGGDLPALQTLQTEQRNGGNREGLKRKKVEDQKNSVKNKALLYERFLTIGTALIERMVKLDGHPMLDRFG